MFKLRTTVVVDIFRSVIVAARDDVSWASVLMAEYVLRIGAANDMEVAY